MGCQLQVENRENCSHQFYIVKFRPSLEEIKKEEAKKKYQFLSTIVRCRINKEIEQLKEDEGEIIWKLKPIYNRESLIKRKSESIRRSESYIAGDKPPKSSVPTRVVNLTDKIDAAKPIRPDQKRCQRRLINKGRMDMEYLQQVEEELLSTKKIGGMTSCGTQELNDLIKSMAQRIQHGSKNRKEEMKIHDKLRELKITREIFTAQEPKTSYYGRRSEYWDKRQEESQRRYKQSLKSIVKNDLYDLEIMKKSQMAYKTKVMRLEAKLQHVKKDIISLQKELEDVHSQMKIMYNLIQMAPKSQETCYDEYQTLLMNVKDVAQTRDVATVKQLCDIQVEEFMAQWNNNQVFRDDYKRRKVINT
uniref:proton pump-interactor BIP131-like n=1 Tax=Erigeron canadensis TaxID=72917 RepID=UPI001CB930C1|nr:proton pump-interactor BIP131-like [Erigeron canadensis]